MKIKILEYGISQYPETISGTDAFYSLAISEDVMCDLYEAEEIYRQSGFYPGMSQALLTVPEGELLKPFTLEENVFVCPPVFEENVLYYLVADLKEKTYRIMAYDTKTRELSLFLDLKDIKIKSGYNLHQRHGGAA